MLPTSMVLLLIGTSLVLIVVGLPMALGKVRQNIVYGVRLPVTMRSRAAWEEANVHYGWWLVWTGAVTLPVVLGVWWVGAGVTGVMIYLGVMTAPLLFGLIPTLKRAYAAERREGLSPVDDSAGGADRSPDPTDQCRS